MGYCVWMCDGVWIVDLCEVEFFEDEVIVDLVMFDVMLQVGIVVDFYLVEVKCGVDGCFEFIYFCEVFCCCGFFNYFYGK